MHNPRESQALTQEELFDALTVLFNADFIGGLELHFFGKTVKATVRNVSLQQLFRFGEEVAGARLADIDSLQR